MGCPVVKDGECEKTKGKRERITSRYLEACYSPMVHMRHQSWSVLARRLLSVEKTIDAWRELIFMPTHVESVHGYMETRTINNGKEYPSYTVDLPLAYLRRPNALHVCGKCDRYTHSREKYMLKCPVCKVARYCSNTCYREDRESHSRICCNSLTKPTEHDRYYKFDQTYDMFQSMTMTLVDAARGLSMFGKFAPIYSVVLTGTKSVTVSLSPLKLNRELRSLLHIDNDTLKEIITEPIDRMILVIFTEGPENETVIPYTMILPLLKRHGEN